MLAPLAVLDLAGLAPLVPAPTAVFGLALLVINTSSSAGDLWIAGLLAQSPSWLQVEDTRGGFTAWAPAAYAAQAQALPPPVGLAPRFMAWIAGWPAATVVCLAVIILGTILIAAGHPGATVRLGPLVLGDSVVAGRRTLRVRMLPLVVLAGFAGTVLTLACAQLPSAIRRS